MGGLSARQTRQAISEGQITEGHGRALAAITIPELQRAVLSVVLEGGLALTRAHRDVGGCPLQRHP